MQGSPTGHIRTRFSRRAVTRGAAAGTAALAVGGGLRRSRPARAQTPAGGEFTREASIVSWGFGTENALAAARVDAFRAAYPNIQLEVIPEFDDQKLLTAAASGQLPDLLWVDRFRISSYAARNVLLALDDYVSQAGIDRGQFYESALDEATYNGALYGLPQFMNVRPLYFNLDALAEIDVNLDDIDTSDWDSLAEIGTQLTQREGDRVIRWGFDPKVNDFFWMWGAGNGGSFINEDGTEVTFDDPAVVEALQWAVDTYEAQGGYQSLESFRTTFAGNEEFARSQVAIIAYENWMLGIIGRTVPDLNFAVRPAYKRDGSGMISFTGGNAWAIPANAPDPEAAWVFINFMNAESTWRTGAEADKAGRAEQGQLYLPTLTANRVVDEMLINDVYEPIDPRYDDAVTLFPELLAQSPNRPVAKSPVGSQLQDILTQEGVLPALRGETDPASALAQADASAQDAIDSF